jgi:hypothetical protein
MPIGAAIPKRGIISRRFIQKNRINKKGNKAGATVKDNIFKSADLHKLEPKRIQQMIIGNIEIFVCDQIR